MDTYGVDRSDFRWRDPVRSDTSIQQHHSFQRCHGSQNHCWHNQGTLTYAVLLPAHSSNICIANHCFCLAITIGSVIEYPLHDGTELTMDMLVGHL